jgi:16S rRNA (cytosine1402-N4)-methyltransferase
VPVLLAEVIAALAPRAGGRYVDCTVGAGGHAEALLEASAPDGQVLALDADADALALARARLHRFGGRVVLVHRNFADLAAVLSERHVGGVEGILFDLGVSSMQLDRAARGFSFTADGPLDMRMDRGRGATAADLVNGLPERELSRILFEYGEEPRSRRIARSIVARRTEAPFRSTADLARVIAAAAAAAGGDHARRIHPATRAFQALRIAVNDELRGLAGALPAALEALAPGGRLAVISFHSLEDRIVKRFFQGKTGRCTCPPGLPVCVCGAQARVRLLSKKPVVPGPAEVARNPRSRSAKLRVAEKLREPGAS